LPILIQQAPMIVQAIVDALVIALPLLLNAAWQLVQMLVSGIVQNLPAIGAAMGQIIGTLAKGVVTLGKDLINIGKNIIEGVIKGILNNKDMFFEQVKRFFQGMITNIKEALGIKSPSKVTFDIGVNTAKGWQLGFVDQFKKAQADIQKSMGGLTLGISAAGADAFGSQNNSYDQSQTQNYYAPVYNVQPGGASSGKAGRW
jgi:hypothetical protein